jgi:hypothetical protein
VRRAREGSTATEFDLGRLVELPGLVEVGRAHRPALNGSVLALLGPVSPPISARAAAST